MTTKKIELPSGHTEDFDLQAGSLGLSVSDVVSRYLKKPGHVLALLRFNSGEDQASVASATGISEPELKAYESGSREPELQHLSALATHYEADMRALLEIFGHVSESASRESMGVAAQFGGELTESEKTDLKKLMQTFARGKTQA